MADVSVAAPQGGAGSQRGRGRRGRWRGGRSRGGRGGSTAATAVAGGEGSQTTQAPPVAAVNGSAQAQAQTPAPAPARVQAPPREPASVPAPVVPPVSSAPNDSSPAPNQGERGGRRGGRRGRGGTQQRSIVTSHRGGRGGRGPIALNARPESPSQPGLSAAAPAFVPGQPIPPRANAERQARPPKPKPVKPTPRTTEKSTATDLPTRIHEDIDNGQYECVICTNEVGRTSRIWSCSTCWTVTHLHCVKKWYTNQMKQKEENQGPNQPEGWRCPGCNSSLLKEPRIYHCWCGKEPDIKPIPGLPPHTCGQTCTKPRTTCPHQCSLMCHAGPCPPCTLMGPTQTCFCGKHTSTKRCTETDYGNGFSCGEVCGEFLSCGEHTCSQTCHSGLCGSCEVPVLSTCYCGKEQKEIPCDRRDEVTESFNYGQLQTSGPDTAEADPWFEGSYRCSNVCGRKYDCGHHTCQKPCHPQDEEAAHCPLSPDMVTKCPCGKTPLASMAVKPRSTCQDPIPHCDKPCDKVLACGHLCPDKCHTGDCAPCFQYIDIACRCAKTVGKSACHQGTVEQPQCFRVCRVQLNCGRHECGERCCSGEKKAMERRKQKRNANDNFEPEHICLQVCGRTLKCGTHTCQQLCHRGPCGSCPERVWDEISCACGRTILHPPQPCGTRPPECRFDCRKPRPCGHPIVPHQCHGDDVECPKCAFLVDKPCICGKRVLKNQPCWLEDARCGLPCGKKLKCGNHECKKPCHKPGACEDADVSGSHCTQVCGRNLKSCEHTCTDQCHAPYPCKEDRPCQHKTFITCSCQRRKQEVRCQATRINPWPNKETTIKCDEECLQLLRKRQLADALKIDPDSHSDDHIPYADKTLKMFKQNSSFAQTQEREFRVFASSSDEKRLRFKPMSAQQRAFLHSLAEDYGLDSESQDQEPHRHVCVFKTPRFVSAPKKTLAQCVRLKQAAAPPPAPKPATPADSRPQDQPYNALLLSVPRFGLTIEEINRALATELSAASRSGPALTFTTSFLPSEDVVIKAVPNFTAAAIATSLAPTPQAVESAVAALKPAVSKVITRLGMAKTVLLCHADSSMNVIRKEGDLAANTGGWSTVASSWKRVAAGKAPAAPAPAKSGTLALGRAGGAFVALRKLELKKKAAEEEKKEEVEEDWETAAAKLEGEDSAGGSGDSRPSSSGSGSGSGSDKGKEIAAAAESSGEGEVVVQNGLEPEPPVQQQETEPEAAQVEVVGC
ncbi:hypothetical protein QBC35DRAFT_481511 [Podospora australis]|uniref:R3H domain-containing protein n=1 Tax=Podospora australis TaxID=1536484 RepID=A0AAN6X3T9_9PEZI|nr:hypothetical protein QBC35DRAFT_481511 [Podospora australis]